MFHILSSSASFTSVSHAGLHKHRWGQKSLLLFVLPRQFDLFLLQGTWESLQEGKVLENKNITLCTEEKKQTIMSALQSELLLLEFALDECCNTILIVTLLQDFLIWSRCHVSIMTIVPTERKHHRTTLQGVQANSRKPMNLAEIHSTCLQF